MFLGRRTTPVDKLAKDAGIEYKQNIKDYSNEELLAILNNINNIDIRLLAPLAAEAARRLLETHIQLINAAKSAKNDT